MSNLTSSERQLLRALVNVELRLRVLHDELHMAYTSSRRRLFPGLFALDAIKEAGKDIREILKDIEAETPTVTAGQVSDSMAESPCQCRSCFNGEKT